MHTHNEKVSFKKDKQLGQEIFLKDTATRIQFTVSVEILCALDGKDEKNKLLKNFTFWCFYLWERACSLLLLLFLFLCYKKGYIVAQVCCFE